MVVILIGQVNTPIPGGIAYENFELTEPFQFGQSYIFGITPLSPEELINQHY